nr:MAR-binding filament-like protein 1-1 [Ipomoea batatas]
MDRLQANLKKAGEEKNKLHEELEEKAGTVEVLQEKTNLQNEASKSKVIITNLTLEQVDLKKMLDAELDTVKGLKQELQIAQENLEKSRNEVSDLKNELEQSRKLCSGLEAEVSAVRSDFVKTRESLHKTIDEAKRGAELLAAELTATKELLKKTNEEMEIISRELASVSETRDSLQKELVDVYKKAESAANDLKEERNIIANLKKELQAVETQILKDKEVQKSLEADLEETTKSLVEMNQNAMVLSKDLELANSTISGLEDEKEMLQKSLSEQKQVSQEARQNMEDAHTLVMRLGKERENLEKKAKKLGEELASAKGEILRLRSQMNSSKTPVNDQPKQKVEVANKATVSTRKYTRRKKSVTEQDDS